MTTIQNSKYPICGARPGMHDLVLVSSLPLWAMVISFAPVLTWRLLMS